MNKELDIISSDELFEKVEQETSNSKVKMASQALLAAINDWPARNLSEPKEFLLVLHEEIGSPLTRQRIENYSKTLSVANKEAWKMEATSSLLEVFEFDKTKTLDEIVRDITIRYKSG